MFLLDVIYGLFYCTSLNGGENVKMALSRASQCLQFIEPFDKVCGQSWCSKVTVQFSLDKEIILLLLV